MESFFLVLVIIAAVVAVLSMIEKLISTNLYRQRYRLNKSGYIKILIPGVPLPCYIYRAKQISEITDKMAAEELALYEKRIIPVHIAAGIQKRLKNTKCSVQDIFTVGEPINSIVKTVSNGMGIINDADPTQSDTAAKWKILKPVGYRVNCFTDQDYLYVM